MNRSRTWAILAVVIVVLLLLFLFFRSGGPAEVEDLGAPADSTDDTGATSTQPASEGQ